MKRYCIDTSGLSYPFELMPEDIHQTLWGLMALTIESGILATTPEIYDEMTHITGKFGDCIRANQDALVLDIGDTSWDAMTYIGHSTRMLVAHNDYISEYNGGSKKTVGLNDMTICALGKALSLPVISGEKRVSADTKRKRKIPDICAVEGVLHMTFNDFLRAEGVRT